MDHSSLHNSNQIIQNVQLDIQEIKSESDEEEGTSVEYILQYSEAGEGIQEDEVMLEKQTNREDILNDPLKVETPVSEEASIHTQQTKCYTDSYLKRTQKPRKTPRGGPSAKQMNLLLSFFEEHRDVAVSGGINFEERFRFRHQWNELVNRLNRMGVCMKSRRQWQKLWSDRKYHVKKDFYRLQRDSPDSLLKLAAGKADHYYDQCNARIMAIMGLIPNIAPSESQPNVDVVENVQTQSTQPLRVDHATESNNSQTLNPLSDKSSQPDVIVVPGNYSDRQIQVTEGYNMDSQHPVQFTLKLDHNYQWQTEQSLNNISDDRLAEIFYETDDKTETFTQITNDNPNDGSQPRTNENLIDRSQQRTNENLIDKNTNKNTNNGMPQRTKNSILAQRLNENPNDILTQRMNEKQNNILEQRTNKNPNNDIAKQRMNEDQSETFEREPYETSSNRENDNSYERTQNATETSKDLPPGADAFKYVRYQRPTQMFSERLFKIEERRAENDRRRNEELAGIREAVGDLCKLVRQLIEVHYEE